MHTLIERRLGEVGRKIHTGRSRNDQVAAAFRLYVADAYNRRLQVFQIVSPAAEPEVERGAGP